MVRAKGLSMGGLLVLLLLCAVGVGTPSAPGVETATAAPQTGVPKSLTVRAMKSSKSSPGVSAAAADYIDCYMRIDNPHESVHFPGTVSS